MLLSRELYERVYLHYVTLPRHIVLLYDRNALNVYSNTIIDVCLLKSSSKVLWSNIRVPMGSHVYMHRVQKTLQ